MKYKFKILYCGIVLIEFVAAVGLAMYIYMNTKSLDKDINNYIVQNRGAIQWQLNSGEAEALEYQAYNMATKQLIQDSKLQTNKPKAVIVDIDETVLNNYGNIIDTEVKSTEGYSQKSFSKWAEKEKATAVPGSKEFLSTAKDLGIQVFYISNRYEDKDLQHTINNLNKLGMPYADKNHVLLKTNDSSKENRVNSIKTKFDVVMYCGDNLDDFPQGFENKSNIERKEIVKAYKEDFGTKYIVIPNAMYGSWDSATYNYDYKKSSQQKINDRQQALINLEK